MGKASITINVGAIWSGSNELEKVNSALSNMEKRVSRSVNSTTRGLALSGKKWSDLGDTIGSIGGKIEAVGESLTRSVTTPAVTLGTYCVDAATTFDSALADLNKTADLTSEELQALGDAALAKSKVQPVTAAEILTLEALGAQLGYSNANLALLADTASGLSIATDMDAETAATELAQFANITGMAQDKTENYGSTIVDLGNHLATTESKISTMALRLAGVSTVASFTEADILGMSGAMSSLGINAEAGGTAMTQIITNISTAVDEGGEQLQNYADVAGTTAEKFAATWKSDPMEALEMLVEGTSNAVDSGQNMSDVLDKLNVSGIRQTDVWRRLSGQSDTLRSAVDMANDAWDKNTALTEEVSKRNESLESRFQTLQNKVDAAATEVGTVLAEKLLDAADALSPLIDGVGDLATAFGDMDPSTQTAITALAGIVVAAGPVITVAGKVVSAIGDVSSKMGDVKEKAAVFGDALNTVDGSSMRVYASSDSLASKLGMAGNAAAEAAGGADKYVAAWEGMTDAAKVYSDANEKIKSLTKEAATATEKRTEAIVAEMVALDQQKDAAKKSYTENGKLVTQWSKSTSEAQKAADGIDGLADAYADVVEETQDFVKESGNANTGMDGLAQKVKGVSSGMGEMLLNFAKATAATVAITALTTAVAYLVEQAIAAKEHEQLLRDATQSVSDIMGDARGSASNLGDAIGDLTPDVEGVLTSLKNLNESVRDTFTDVAVSSTKLDQYTATIQELANQSGLTEAQQYRLKAAVEGYNEVCGTSYEVTDATNGKISDSKGIVQETTDELLKNADAWKKNAEAQAYQSVAAEYLEAQVRAQQELSIANANLETAQRNYNSAMDEYMAKLADGTMTQEDAELALHEYAQKVDEAQVAVDELSDACNAASNNYSLASAQAVVAASSLDTATQTVANNIAAAVMGMDANVSTALANESINLGDLAVAMAGAGLSATDMANITSDQFASMVTRSGGNLDQLVAKIAEYAGVELPSKDADVTITTNAEQATGEINDASAAARAMQDGAATAEYKGGAEDGTDAAAIRDTTDAANAMPDVTATVAAEGNVIEGSAATSVKSFTDRINAMSGKNVTASASGNVISGSATTQVNNLINAINRLSGKTVTVTTNYVTTGTPSSGHAAGGIRTHASGGIVRYHAGGAIVNVPGAGYPLDLVGEKGAEAIVPLTNKRYALPFVRMIAEETVKQGATGGPNIYINGVNVNDYADIVSATRDYLVALNHLRQI